MTKDINLLPDIALEEERSQKVRKLFSLAGILILMSTIIAVIVVYSMQVLLQNETNNLVKVNNQLREDITSFNQLELDFRSLKSKSTSVSTILSESRNFEKYLSRLIAITPTGVSLNTVSISESNALTLSGEADNSNDVRSFIVNLIADEKEPTGLFSSANMSSLTLSSDGRFQFGIGVVIKN